MSRSVDQVCVLAMHRLTGDAKLGCDSRPGRGRVRDAFPVAVVERVRLDADDRLMLRAALDYGFLDQPVEVLAGGGEFVEAVERIGRPGEFVYAGLVSHASTLADRSRRVNR